MSFLNRFIENKKKKVTLWRALSYGAADIMGGSSNMLITTYLMFFYTTFVGLTPVAAASIFAGAKIIDAIASVWMGSLSDTFYNTKLGKLFGRRRFFLLIGSPLVLTYGLLWVNGLNYWFYFCTYVLFDIVATVILIPFETLPMEMTTDFNERTLLSTCRMFMSGAFSSICPLIGAEIIHVMGEHNPNAYFVLGGSFAVFYMCCIFLTYTSTWERSYEEFMSTRKLEPQKIQQSFFSFEGVKTLCHIVIDYLSTLRVRAFRQHLALYLLGVTAQDIFVTVFMYYVVFVIHQTTLFGGSLLSISLISLPLTPISYWLFIRLGPANLYKICYTMVIMGCVGYYIMAISHVTNIFLWAIIISTIYQIGKGFVYSNPWNTFSFIPDVDEMITTKRREGLFAAMMTFCRKLTGSVGMIIVGAVLEYGGFVKQASEQPPTAIDSILNILLFGVGGMTFLALLVSFTFTLNKKNHGILIDEIQRLKNGGSKDDVDPKTKKVVESLTGVEYRKLYPTLTDKHSA